MPKRLRQETIVWRDSWTGYSDKPYDVAEVETGYFLVDTGFLAKETRDEVVIATSVSAHGDDARMKFMHGIPKKAIVSRSSRWLSVPEPRKGK